VTDPTPERCRELAEKCSDLDTYPVGASLMDELATALRAFADRLTDEEKIKNVDCGACDEEEFLVHADDCPKYWVGPSIAPPRNRGSTP